MRPELLKYIQSQSRNKIVFYKNDLYNLESINLGKELSEQLKGIVNDKRMVMKALNILDEILSSSIKESSLYGKYLSIKNIGILFEPSLKIEFLQLLNKYSLSNALFIQWNGEIENNNLYFLSKLKEQKINIENLSHITI
jgi:hypothetical protein